MSAYQDRDGNPIALSKLVRDEPEWAASRIATMTDELAASGELRTKVGEAIRDWDLGRGIPPSMRLTARYFAKRLRSVLRAM